jgi:hypothetical protein
MVLYPMGRSSMIYCGLCLDVTYHLEVLRNNMGKQRCMQAGLHMSKIYRKKACSQLNGLCVVLPLSQEI